MQSAYAYSMYLTPESPLRMQSWPVCFVSNIARYTTTSRPVGASPSLLCLHSIANDALWQLRCLRVIGTRGTKQSYRGGKGRVVWANDAMNYFGGQRRTGGERAEYASTRHLKVMLRCPAASLRPSNQESPPLVGEWRLIATSRNKMQPTVSTLLMQPKERGCKTHTHRHFVWKRQQEVVVCDLITFGDP